MASFGVERGPMSDSVDARINLVAKRSEARYYRGTLEDRERAGTDQQSQVDENPTVPAQLHGWYLKCPLYSVPAYGSVLLNHVRNADVARLCLLARGLCICCDN